ncbi:MAG: YfiR family protein [Methylococcaceae bacterium]|nr:YfiR family protein [Methylococcaceae bacterium]
MTVMISINLKTVVADSVEEYTAKSILALNLARFSEWPLETFKENKTSVDLCIWGDSTIVNAFSMIDKKPVGNKSLSLRKLSDVTQLENCHLLYIGEEKRNIAGLIEESYKRHILTIGENEDFLSNGGAVYLEVADSKINLHVNVSAMEKAGVRISSRVLKLATIFNP